MLFQNSSLCFRRCAILLLLLLQRPLLADDAVYQQSGSFAAPAAFQSPKSAAQSSANTAATIHNPAPAASHLTEPNAISEEIASRPITKQQPIVLRDSRPATRLPQPADRKDQSSMTAGSQSVMTVLGSLGIVVGLFLVSMWIFRGAAPKAAQSLPPEVVEPLGRTPVAKGRQLQLFRFGNKLVLVTVSPTGVDVISEIADPVEVDRIAGLCHRNGTFSSTAAFRKVLDSFAGSDEPPDSEIPREFGREGSRRRVGIRIREDGDA